jgi:hypothetical protein
MGSAAGSSAEFTGENLWLNVISHTVPTSAGAATVQAVFQDSPDNAAWTDRLAGPVLGFAAATPGTALLQAQPPVGTQRFWRIVFRIATAVLTAGAFDAYVSNTIQRNTPRPSGFVVS